MVVFVGPISECFQANRSRQHGMDEEGARVQSCHHMPRRAGLNSGRLYVCSMSTMLFLRLRTFEALAIELPCGCAALLRQQRCNAVDDSDEKGGDISHEKLRRLVL